MCCGVGSGVFKRFVLHRLNMDLNVTRSDSLSPASVLAPAPDIERSALRTSASLRRCAQLRRVRLFAVRYVHFLGLSWAQPEIKR